MASERDIEAHADLIKNTIKGNLAPGELGVSTVASTQNVAALIDATAFLLTTALVDLNRIANAMEILASPPKQN